MVENILVIGGAGYIGSQTVLRLLLRGFNTVVIDNLDNSSVVSIQRVKGLAGDYGQNLTVHQVDLRDKPALDKVFSESKFDTVMDFSGLKAVGESVAEPLLYYDNFIGTITLLEVMGAHGCRRLVFSSYATEESPLSGMSPYGSTKLLIEDIFRDVHHADPEWRIVMLRYSNPVGAQPSGPIGEVPCGTSNNLMPYIQQAVVFGSLPNLNIYGTDYATKDGTGVRHYIHVVDIADGQICAIRKLDDTEIGCEVPNLGTGKGTMVLEMADASEKASGMKTPVVKVGRRPGDPIEADGVSEKSVVSGIQFQDLSIEADEGPLHKLSAYLCKQRDLALVFCGRLMSVDIFPAESKLERLEEMEDLVAICEEYALSEELFETEVKEKWLDVKKLIFDAKDELKKAKEKLKQDKNNK